MTIDKHALNYMLTVLNVQKMHTDNYTKNNERDKLSEQAAYYDGLKAATEILLNRYVVVDDDGRHKIVPIER